MRWFPEAGRAARSACVPVEPFAVVKRGRLVSEAAGRLPTALNLLSSEGKEEASDPRAGLPTATLGGEGFACLPPAALLCT